MKFIHSADIHLDSLSSRLKRLAGQKELSIAKCQHKAFQALVDLAIEEKVDFVLISGDLFDANWKDFSVGLMFIQEINRLSCPIYYIRGNHDSENRLLKKLPYPDHLFLFDSESAHTYINDQLKVAIHGQSYFHYHTQSDLSLNYPKAKPGYFNIGLLHTSGEISNGEKPYAPYDLRTLQSKNYDYWAMGHIHSAQIVSKNPYRVYSGVLQGRHIKETGSKGCYLIEVDNFKVVSVNFKAIASHLWEELYIDLSDICREEELKQRLISSFKNMIHPEEHIEGYILRLIFTGVFKLEKRIHFYQEYWRSCIYLWLSEAVEQKIYIEKLIDRTSQDLSSDGDKNTIFNAFRDELKSIQHKNWIEETFNEEKDFMFRKLPKELIDLLDKDEEDSSFNDVKEYIGQKLQEIINENSPT